MSQNNITNQEDKAFLLGVILKITGLSTTDIAKIANNELMLDESKTPSDIRNYILEDSEFKVTLLRRLNNIGIPLNEFSNNFKFNTQEVVNNIDNFFYYVNAVDFKLRTSSILRNQMIDFLVSHHIRNREIAEILDIGYSTVRNYLR